jgi:Zn-dependent protease
VILAQIEFFVLYLLAFIPSITVHEFAHAFTATKLGDRTPIYQGRFTLNPLAHLDMIGALSLIVTSLIGCPFGWGKSVLVMKANFRNPKSGSVLVATAGPLANMIIASMLVVIMAFGAFGFNSSSLMHKFIFALFDVNLVMAIFNLVPIPPMDGAQILVNLLPEKSVQVYIPRVAKWGWLVLFILVAFGGRLLAIEMAKINLWLTSN